MKAYLAVGIGDMMCLDSILTAAERAAVTEIYWGTHVGKDIAPLMETNIYYNVRKQHFIQPEMGKAAMRHLYPATPEHDLFWHFRSDLEPNFSIGKQLFGATSTDIIEPINQIRMFQDPRRVYQGSTFLMCAKESDVDWQNIGVGPQNYILVHYPTSTRPRTDIARIEDEDWDLIENLSKQNMMKVVIITDTDIQPKLSNFIVLKKPSIHAVVALSKYAHYYVGCDSFVSILCCKVLPYDHLYIKTHDRDIYHKLPGHVWLQRFFLPNSYDIIQKFYRSSLKI